jgi:hypothetical protein
MSIIYSYPTSQPTVDDLLIGTDVNDDNATKSFSVQSLVSLINAAQGTGIITDVTISTTDIFLQAIKTSQPGAAAITYTVGLTSLPTSGLETTQFLRGDNQWVVPVVSAGIGVAQNNIGITSDVQLFNFTGTGVGVIDNGNGQVGINIDNSDGLITSVNPGLGIEILNTIGDVTVTNTGILSIAEGEGIQVVTANGVTTISTTAQSSTFISVQPGLGLQLEGTGTVNVDPTIGINYSGTGNFINSIPTGNTATALPADTILFEQETSGDIKSTTWGELQATTLTLVNTEITTADSRNVKNSTDEGITVPRINNVVTLLQSEYDAAGFVKVANTLYLTKAGASSVTFTKEHIITDNIDNPLGAAYTVTSTVANGAYITRAEGTQESWTTSVALSDPSSYKFSSSNPLSITPNPNVVIFNNNSAVTTSITGTIEAVEVGQCVSTLTILNSVTGNGAVIDTDYEITFTGPASRTSTTGCDQVLNPEAEWNVQIALKAGTGTGPNAVGSDKYTLDNASISYTYNPANPTTYALAETITCQVAAVFTRKLFTIDYNVTDNITPTGNHTLNTLSTITAWNNSSSTGAYPQASLVWGTLGFQVGTQATATSPYTFTSGPSYAYTGTSYGPIVYENRTITLDITGTTAIATGWVQLGVANYGVTGCCYALSTEYQIEEPDGTIIQAWTGYPGSNISGGQISYLASNDTDVGNIIKTAVTIYPSSGYTFTSGPTYNFEGVIYNLGGESREVVATTTIQAGENLLASATWAGNAIANPTLAQRSAMNSISGVVCGYLQSSYVSFWFGKGSGNSSFWPQRYDIAYSNVAGTAFLPVGYYAMGIDPTTGAGTGSTVRSEVYVDVNGIIGAPSACS